MSAAALYNHQNPYLSPYIPINACRKKHETLLHLYVCLAAMCDVFKMRFSPLSILSHEKSYSHTILRQGTTSGGCDRLSRRSRLTSSSIFIFTLLHFGHVHSIVLDLSLRKCDKWKLGKERGERGVQTARGANLGGIIWSLCLVALNPSAVAVALLSRSLAWPRRAYQPFIYCQTRAPLAVQNFRTVSGRRQTVKRIRDFFLSFFLSFFLYAHFCS